MLNCLEQPLSQMFHPSMISTQFEAFQQLFLVTGEIQESIMNKSTFG